MNTTKKQKKSNKTKANQKPKQAGKKNGKLEFKTKENPWLKRKKSKPQRPKNVADTNFFEGRIKRHADGFGFFIPEDPSIDDIYINVDSMGGAMTNDKVLVRAFKLGPRSSGEIIEILERHMKTVTGKWVPMDPHRGIIVDESYGWGEDLKITPSEGIEIVSGDWVYVEITSYPDSHKGFWGKVLEVIGKPQDIKTDYRRILLQSGIPVGFSDTAVQEAEKFTQTSVSAELNNRIDLRELSFVTIDGQTAKDFDDAIHIAESKNGFRVRVGIADVSHYVLPGSSLDKEAYLKGTSTYFPGFVEPMIPECLSNGLCSLRPDIDRLALVADMVISYSGELQKTEFYEAVIKSHGRLTYGEAQEILDDKASPRDEAIKKMVCLAGDLAKILLSKRLKEGSLELEISDSAIEIDGSGIPVDIMKGERLFAHRLIEEFMLMTNIAVAQRAQKAEREFLFRVHDVPKTDKLELLEKFLGRFGSNQRLGGGKLQTKITNALSSFSGQKEGHILNILALRSMCQATYSSENIGHFGLGFKDYCHFTSPIRRYPDLWIHRFIKSLSQNLGKEDALSEASSVGTWLSACEQRSVKAERQVNSILKARFMRQFLGQEFDGIISSSAKFGVFVIIRDYDVDGLVKVEAFPGDNYYFDEDNLMWVGKKSGRTYGLGDMIKIQVQSVDDEKGLIDFGIVEGDEFGKSKTQKVQTSQKRRSSKEDRGSVRKARVSGSRRKGKAR